MRKDWRLALGAPLFAAVFYLNIFPVSDPDTWWHLKTGDLILKAFSIPRTDPFSYTIAGRPWVSFEWLSQTFFAAAFAAGGAACLMGLKALVIGAACVLFFRLGRAGLWAGLLLCGAAWSSGSYTERPHIFDPLLLGLLLNWLEDGIAQRRQVVRILALHALWANLHGGAALLGVFAVGLKAAADRRSAAAWLKLALGCAAAMALNPHGARIFSQLFQTLTFPGRESIVEWQPLGSLMNRHGPFFALALAAACASWREELALCLLGAALGCMAAWAVRYLPLFEFSACALAARALERRLPGHLDWRRACVVFAAAILAISARELPRGVGLREFPESAAAFLDRAGVGGRMFNEYNLGGYLIWKCFPRRPVFIDGRNAEYGADFVRAAVHWYEPTTWAALDSRWHFDYAVIENAQAYRAQVLDGSPDWALAFWDDASLVYLRREPANAATLSRAEYKWLKPNQLSYGYLAPLLKDGKKAPGIMAEIERAVSESAQNDNARLMRAYALELLGRGREALPDLEAAVRRSPRKPGPLISLAWWYASNGDAPSARGSYQGALALARSQGDALSQAYIYDNLGVLEGREGKISDSERLFRKSLSLRPDYEPALSHLRRLESASHR